MQTLMNDMMMVISKYPPGLTRKALVEATVVESKRKSFLVPLIMELGRQTGGGSKGRTCLEAQRIQGSQGSLQNQIITKVEERQTKHFYT